MRSSAVPIQISTLLITGNYLISFFNNTELDLCMAREIDAATIVTECNPLLYINCGSEEKYTSCATIHQ